MNNATAIKRIADADKSGALVFIDRENGFPLTELYTTEITSIRVSKDECHEITSKFMPKKEVVDRIGEACGITFIMGDSKTSTLDDSTCGKRTVYTAFSQGKRRMPDGSWRESNVEPYEFDPTLRAMLDFSVTEINEATKKRQRIGENGQPYGSTLARAILEYQKVACQRASTGARLRVIRSLVGMPISFSPDEISKPLVFSRIVQNTNYILDMPEGRLLAAAQATGADISHVFGGRKAIPEPIEAAHTISESPPPNDQPPAAPSGDTPETIPDFDDESSEKTTQTVAQKETPEQVAFRTATTELTNLIHTHAEKLDVTTPSGKNPFRIAKAELESDSGTIESRKTMTAKMKVYLEKLGVKE
jgi:hypothetical protein